VYKYKKGVFFAGFKNVNLPLCVIFLTFERGTPNLRGTIVENEKKINPP
jgi:hypothetical protein